MPAPREAGRLVAENGKTAPPAGNTRLIGKDFEGCTALRTFFALERRRS